MLITRVELENIKSYKKVSVAFRSGTTAISGSNGAGKTTLVEAIGYALFNHLPYKQDQFVREGEKYGRITIHLIGGDDRPYIVERRVGSGARWFMTDKESTERLEQGADMQDRLHDLFGIDRERPLDSLFKDALGVPQGTFTAIFLETAKKRKDTFDALLQIEDYKTSSDYLLQVKHYYDEQSAIQRVKIGELTVKTSSLEDWRTQLAELQGLDAQQHQQRDTWTEDLSALATRLTELTAQKYTLDQLRQQFESNQAKHASEEAILKLNAISLQEAQTAQVLVQANLDLFQQYGQAERELISLREDEQKRNKLREQNGKLQNTKTQIEAQQHNLHERMEDVERARQKVEQLAPLVLQQTELERQRNDYNVKAERYKQIMKEGTRLRSTVDKSRSEQAELQQRIISIKPLQPLADLFQERYEVLTQLQAQGKERARHQQNLQRMREDLALRQRERDSTSDKLRRVEAIIDQIEVHRHEAEEMPTLVLQRTELTARQNKLEGNIEGYVKSRKQSAGGQCPFLHETCLNIKGRGMVSLESYFDSLLKDEHVELDSVRLQQRGVAKREIEIQKYVKDLETLGIHIERRQSAADQLQSLAMQIARSERDIESAIEEMNALTGLDAKVSEAKKSYEESKNADSLVRGLPSLYDQVHQYEKQIQDIDAALVELRQELSTLKGSETLLQQTESELAALHDPRSQSLAQQHTIEQESSLKRRLQAEDERLLAVQEQIQDLDVQLQHFAELDNTLRQQEVLRQSSLRGYQIYLQNEGIASSLPERERIYQQQALVTSEAQTLLQASSNAFESANAAFDLQELQRVNDEVERLKDALATLKSKIEHNRHSMSIIEGQIAQAELFLQELIATQKELQTLEDLNTMMAQFRGYIKEAAPYVLKAILADISAEANRIFGEIMGDRTAQLSWQNDYEVVLRRQSSNRTFAQLSGGEQMSAALAIRLALLKKLSTLNLAFFDEPTQNMDEFRRMNLAEQIRRVRGFDQLLVISHDDTFEQGLDSIVRLKKEHNETRLVTDEEAEQERMVHYAS